MLLMVEAKETEMPIHMFSLSLTYFATFIFLFCYFFF